MELPPKEVQTFLAEHNLHACAAELKRIKQAIRDGRLWEHLEMRAHGHPALFQALKKLKKYEDYLERHDPAVKNSGLFFFSSIGLGRPEIVRHKKRLAERYTPPSEAKILLLLPQTRRKPFHKSQAFTDIIGQLQALKKPSMFHACVYSAPFGVVPTELDEIYPLSQHETIQNPDKETSEYVATQLADYISRTRYETVVLIDDTENWGKSVLTACRRACAKKKIRFKRIAARKKQEKNLTAALKDAL
jgi:7-cyano-7-deazaguanine tRNA-ribosyltransferase